MVDKGATIPVLYCPENKFAHRETSGLRSVIYALSIVDYRLKEEISMNVQLTEKLRR